MRAIIIGAGIGGLTTAIALVRCGIDAQVYERSPALRDVGAGIGLWQNAVTALQQLGLGDRLQSISVTNGDAALRRWNGAYISRTSARELERRFGSGMIVVHRAELLDILIQALGPARIHLDHTLSSVDQDASEARAHFTNHATATGDVLIGADGLHSHVRAQLGHVDPIRYAGYTAWRSVVPFDRSALVPAETWGPGRRFGAFPIAGNRVYWFATNNAAEGARESDSSAKSLLLSLFKGWHEPIEALIQAADDAGILRNDIYDRDPSRKWGHGRITLLGDAAHPMTPNLGQGACQAIEDGLVLARCLAAEPAAEQALRNYETERIARTSGIVMKSRRIGSLAQIANPIQCWMRDKIFQLLPDSVTYRSLAPIIGYRGHLNKLV